VKFNVVARDASDSDTQITRFRGLGRGLLVTRDHMDLGSSLCSLGGVGNAHHFHTRNLDPDQSRRVIDDPFSTHISWPNFHSGANGDFQEVAIVAPRHPVLTNPDSPTGAIDPEKSIDPRQNRQSAALTQALMDTYVEQLERA
jgi:hypothetical protein